jgi:ABC-2 type transport system permease protein
VTRPARELWAVLAIAERDVIKLLRDRPRLAVNLAFPILLVAGLGSVLQPTVGRVTGLNTVTLAFSGVLAATAFQSTAAGMISLVEDRKTDYSRALFAAPVTRLTLISGKIAGETLVALVQAGCVAAFALAAGVRLGAGQAAILLPACLACCLLGGAFGLATVAAIGNQRSAMEIFQFLIIPQYLLGGVIVPLAGVAPFLTALADVMPLRYAVDLTRAAYYRGTPAYGRVVAGGPALDLAVIATLAAVFLTAGVILFDRHERS